MTTWPEGLFEARDLDCLGMQPRAISRAVAKGGLIRVKRGAYISERDWIVLDAAAKHQIRVRAAASAHPQAVFSHWSAAVIHGLPIIGRWPSDVHVAADRSTGGRSEVGVRRHCVGLPDQDWTVVDGIRVTTVARTIVDLALVQPFRYALAPADYSLASGLVTNTALSQHLDSRGAFRGLHRAVKVVEFATPSSKSPGESLSRGVIHEQGFPAPELQVEHHLPDGLAITDFEWPEYNLIGEFDGHGKYLKDDYLKGKSTVDTIMAEKRRENSLRRITGRLVVRWEWADVFQVTPLVAMLTEIGLPRRSRAR